MTKEHHQAYMQAFGADILMDDYREQTAELSQEFSQFGAATLKSMGWSKYGWADYQKRVGQLAASLHRVESKWDDPDAKGWFWRVELHRKGSVMTLPLDEGFAATATKAAHAAQRNFDRHLAALSFGSDFKTIDPACYAPGGAPGCEFGATTYGNMTPAELRATRDRFKRQRRFTKERWSKKIKALQAKVPPKPTFPPRGARKSSKKGQRATKGQWMRWMKAVRAVTRARFSAYVADRKKVDKINAVEWELGTAYTEMPRSPHGGMKKHGKYHRRLRRGYSKFGAATLKSMGWKKRLPQVPPRKSDKWVVGQYTKKVGQRATAFVKPPSLTQTGRGWKWEIRQRRIAAHRNQPVIIASGYASTPTQAAQDADHFVATTSTYFGRMGVPAGMQLPGSWGVPDASMVRPGETPEGWDPNLFRGFGGRFDKAALRKQREDFKTIYRGADIDLRKATDLYHANPTLSALTQVRKFGNRRNKAWKKIMKIQDQLGNKGLPFVAPVADPWWNQ